MAAGYIEDHGILRIRNAFSVWFGLTLANGPNETACRLFRLVIISGKWAVSLKPYATDMLLTDF